jgi:hypothetical protein
MRQNFVAVPSQYIFVFCIILTVTIATLVVWPAVWSNNPFRRQAAYMVLDRILKFLRSIVR